MSKYKKLSAYLDSLGESERHVSFKALESILGFALPASARMYSAWWANDARQGRHATAWLSAGWRTGNLNLSGETVTFHRDAGAGKLVTLTCGQPSQRTRAVAGTFDVSALPKADGFNPLELAIGMTWRTLGSLTLDESGKIVFPPVPDVAGLYRLRLPGAGQSRHYIGETVRLRRRFYHYANPGPSQATNIRINALLREHLEAGESIKIDIMTDADSMVIAGATMPVNFLNKATRRLFEHAAIVSEDGAEIESLNR
ncbi:hypothetical protein KG088_17950 [Halomonas sp. TRM85114]|uniref:DUF7662 domain-containing protein n=1 Tax=Halomonas jincaotanensis TaxID=2810616 RepID=UPI001BD39AB6|nr:hypothetical protein [Halomonas jincaotanensis]MBS9405490.1 hypothetical protein [Halomonas jincaotanensis]